MSFTGVLFVQDVRRYSTTAQAAAGASTDTARNLLHEGDKRHGPPRLLDSIQRFERALYQWRGSVHSSRWRDCSTAFIVDTVRVLSSGLDSSINQTGVYTFSIQQSKPFPGSASTFSNVSENVQDTKVASDDNERGNFLAFHARVS